PLTAAAIASARPVLLAVASTIVPPGCSRPRRSASSIMAKPMRSLMEPPGFAAGTRIFSRTHHGGFASEEQAEVRREAGGADKRRVTDELRDVAGDCLHGRDHNRAAPAGGAITRRRGEGILR